MNQKKHMILLAAVAAGTLALAGCKKDAGAKEIELPEGQIHLGAQWAGSQLWVESLDPKSNTCTFAQYQGGKVVEDSVITFKNCRAAGGTPMMRPMMPARPGMMPNSRPMMPGKPAQMPAQPSSTGTQPAPQSAPAEQ